MGSDPAEVALAVEQCKHEPLGDEACERLFEPELEAHPVTLDAFWIDRTEVTVSAYQRCVALGSCRSPSYGNGGQRFDRPELPVVLVDWGDAQQFCRFSGGRLPTEAEWERAARGVDARRYPWGNLYNPRVANHGLLLFLFWPDSVRDPTDDRDGYEELAPVGSYPDGRTGTGIDDLAGNAAEWVLDALDDPVSARYAPASEVNPRGQATGAYRVVRGGSYRDASLWLRATARSFQQVGAREPDLGFRCVRPKTPSP